MKITHRFLAVAALGCAAALFQTPVAIANSHIPQGASALASDYVEGEVKRIDKEAGKITLKHGPIANLDMTAMSMVFRAKDVAMLDKVNVGDKVRFKAEKIHGALTVTQIEKTR